MTACRVWMVCGGLLLVMGCTKSPASSTAGPATYAGTGPISVTCTTGMVADVVRELAGAHANVTQLMGEGVDPHLFKAAPSDISQLNSADMIFYSGLNLEGKMGDLFVRMARRKPTFAVTEHIPEDRLIQVSESHHDPHLWFDVGLWKEAVPVVRDALAGFDPPHAAAYQANAQRYFAELESLDQECREQIAEIPVKQRILVTAHDAFHYFGRAYAMEVRAIQGVSTESEAGVKEINDLVEFIATRGVKAVFVETSVSDRNMRSLIEGCAARGHTVTVGGSLFSDAMGQPGTPEGTYIGMVRANVRTLVEALR